MHSLLGSGLALACLALAACTHSQPTSSPAPAETTIPSPAASIAAPPSTACAAGTVPAGSGGECVKTCQADADCTGPKQKCRPTSYDMGGGQIAHDTACF